MGQDPQLSGIVEKGVAAVTESLFSVADLIALSDSVAIRYDRCSLTRRD